MVTIAYANRIAEKYEKLKAVLINTFACSLQGFETRKALLQFRLFMQAVHGLASMERHEGSWICAPAPMTDTPWSVMVRHGCRKASCANGSQRWRRLLASLAKNLGHSFWTAATAGGINCAPIAAPLQSVQNRSDAAQQLGGDSFRYSLAQ